jgi:hypothetical protein
LYVEREEEEITPPAVTSRSGARWEETHMDDRDANFYVLEAAVHSDVE